MPRVLIGAALLRHAKGSYREILQAGGFEIVYPKFHRLLTENELLAELEGVDAALAGGEPYTRRVFEARPQLKVVSRSGVGYDSVDVPAATDHGVPVTVTPCNHDAVAEHTFALILALAKQVIPQHAALQRGDWPRSPTRHLRGQTLGIVGLGRIGKAVALRARAFGMKVIACDPRPNREFVAQQQIELMPLERVCSEADFVSLHLPLDSTTSGLINRACFERMKPTAYLINTARGGVVNEAELIEALRSKRIAGAGLDVFEVEPLRDSPLSRLDNVTITAHTAGVDLQSSQDMSEMAADTIVRLSRGEWPEELIVNPEAKLKFRWNASSIG